jgi:hypothetical protein
LTSWVPLGAVFGAAGRQAKGIPYRLAPDHCIALDRLTVAFGPSFVNFYLALVLLSFTKYTKLVHVTREGRGSPPATRWPSSSMLYRQTS